MADGRDKREEESQEAPKRNFSLMDFLNPQHWFGGIGNFFGSVGGFFGGLMGMVVPALVIGTGLYFFGQTKTGQELMGKLFGEGGEEKVKGFFDNIGLMFAGLLDQIGMHGMLEKKLEDMPIEEVHTLLAKQGMNEATIQILAKTKPEFMENFHFIKENGGSVLNPINDKVLYAYLDKKPEVVAQLIAANTGAAATVAGGAGNSAVNDKQKDFAAKIMGSLQAIVADGRIDNLLKADNKNRQIYLSMVQQQMGSTLPISAEQLGKMIDLTAFGEDGKLTENFRTALKGMLSDKAEDRSNAIASLLVSPEVTKHKQELDQVIDSIPVEKIADPKMKATVAQTQVMGVAVAQAGARLQLLGVDVKHELEIFNKGGPTKLLSNALTELMDNNDLRAKLAANNRAGLSEVGFILDDQLKKTINPQEKAALQFVMTRSADGKSYQNLNALFNLVNSIDSKGDDGRNKAVLGQLIGLIAADTPQERKQAIGNINASEFAAFMKDHQTAFGTFLATMNNHYLGVDQQRLVGALRATWGNANNGMAEVMSDPKAVHTLLEQMAKPSQPHPQPFTAVELGKLMAGFKLAGGKIDENGNTLIKFMQISQGQIPVPARPAAPVRQ